MRKLLLLLSLVTIVCCGGAGDTQTPARFAGTYAGTWTQLDDATDAGTSTWTFEVDGTVTGQDVDPGRDTTFQVWAPSTATGA